MDSFEAQMVDADVPVLLSIDDIDRLSILLENLSTFLIYTRTGMKAPTTRVNGHPFLQGNSYLSCMLTSVDRHHLHRRFGQPSTEKLMNLLNRSEVYEIGPDTRKILNTIERACYGCQRYAQKPCRFKFCFA